eukprot:TRINITY_DN5849_c0_g2_i2.p2 TRINITY_DN5849_c0_g2~~TRINITY_DN5849_c0_g2_i2.p2  ORF type:complete len:589 (+),score=117.66 TRINITY_DN5849_c0_g2_i2:14-1780(+)
MGQDQSTPKTLASASVAAGRSQAAPPAGAAKSAVPVSNPPQKKKATELAPPSPRGTAPPSAAAKSSAPKAAAPAKKNETLEKSPSVKEKPQKLENQPSKSTEAPPKPKSASSSPAPVWKQKTLAPVSAKSTASAQKANKKAAEKALASKAKQQPAPPPKKRKLSDSSDDFQEEKARKTKEERVDAEETFQEVEVWTEPKAELAPSQDFFLLKPQVVVSSTRQSVDSKKLELNPLVPRFVLGAYYRRKEIIAKYKGQTMSGIVTPANARYLFIFSSAHETAESNPYVDGWRGDEFWYTGEGLKGDQKMTKGNFKIKEHVQLKRHIFLFQKAKLNEKLHRYVGEFRCQSTRVVDGMDSENKPRKEFKFILTRIIDYEILSDNEELETERDALQPARFNRHEALPGLGYGAKRPGKMCETRLPLNATVLPQGAGAEDVRRPQLGEILSMAFPVADRSAKKVKSVLRATQVSTQAASRDFVPGRVAYVSKRIKNRPSVYDGTDGPKELDLDGIEYREEQKEVVQPAKMSNLSMKRKRQEKKLQLLLESAARDGYLDDEEDANENGSGNASDQSEEVADEPPAKRAKIEEDSE